MDFLSCSCCVVFSTVAVRFVTAFPGFATSFLWAKCLLCSFFQFSVVKLVTDFFSFFLLFLFFNYSIFTLFFHVFFDLVHSLYCKRGSTAEQPKTPMGAM